jgi:hypothetical protein
MIQQPASGGRNGWLIDRSCVKHSFGLRIKDHHSGQVEQMDGGIFRNPFADILSRLQNGGLAGRDRINSVWRPVGDKPFERFLDADGITNEQNACVLHDFFL